METPKRAQCHFSKGLLLSASVLALWIPQGTWAALRIQKIPEHPQKDENLLLSVQGIPGAFQDFNWYLGEETNGGTMLFTYFPDLQRPQRDGSAMGQRDIVGFPNGSMLLHHVQPTDSGTYQVAVTINPEWTMRAKTEVRVAGECCAPDARHGPGPAQMPRHVVLTPPFNPYRSSTCVPGPEDTMCPSHALTDQMSIECHPRARRWRTRHLPYCTQALTNEPFIELLLCAWS
uniref:Immunoglobulin V-set domain-containing protein n=1 Tax=Ursus americanus TaxID=9643 RepID=A0A452QUN7_URSAM